MKSEVNEGDQRNLIKIVNAQSIDIEFQSGSNCTKKKYCIFTSH